MDLIQPTKTRLLSQPNLHLKFVCPGTKCDFIWGKNRVIFLFTLQEVFGYQTQKLRRVLFLVTSVLTCGVLPLLFYWKPQWRVWAALEQISDLGKQNALLSNSLFSQCKTHVL